MFDPLDDDPEDDGYGRKWMATLADLSILMLTFFVLLLSFADLDVIKFRMALGSVKDALGVESTSPGDLPALSTSAIELSTQPSAPHVQLIEEIQLLARIRKPIRERNMVDEIDAEISERGVIIRVKGTVLFETAKSDLRDGSAATLDTIVELARELPYPILIEGHTDDRPIHTTRFPSNWELSTQRAIAAMRYLVEVGHLETGRIGVAGYAATRPVASNDTDEGRLRNRRVEFVFLRPLDTRSGSAAPNKPVRRETSTPVEPTSAEPTR